MNSPKVCSLKTISFADEASSLPEIRPFDEVDLGPVDVMILSKGFEERVLEVPRLASEKGLIASNTTILVGEYRTNQEDNEKRFLQLAPFLDVAKRNISFFDAESPAHSDVAISQALEAAATRGECLSVLFDLSGASSTLIFSVFAAVFRSPIEVKFELAYAEADFYYPDASSPDGEALELRHTADWTAESPREKGAGDAEYHELFKGHEIESRPNHIIGVPSLSSDRFERCVYHLGDETSLAPKDVLTLVVPYTDSSDHYWRESVIRELAKRLFETNQDENREVQLPNIVRCDTHQYKQIIGEIFDIAEKHQGHNMFLVHFGPKLQTVGAALALLARSEITLMFTRPRQFFASRYSRGVGKVWSLSFQDPRTTLRSLQQIGCLNVCWDEVAPDGVYSRSTS